MREGVFAGQSVRDGCDGICIHRFQTARCSACRDKVLDRIVHGYDSFHFLHDGEYFQDCRQQEHNDVQGQENLKRFLCISDEISHPDGTFPSLVFAKIIAIF